jgi:predicted acyltransferase
MDYVSGRLVVSIYRIRVISVMESIHVPVYPCVKCGGDGQLPGNLISRIRGTVGKDEYDRIISVDVFRGLTIAAMILVNNPGSWSHVYSPLRHAEWHGWTVADTVFPFFLFIVGVSVAVSFGRKLEAGVERRPLYMKIVRRVLILFALGLFLNAFPSFELSTLRIPGVLQRIAVCYLAAAVIFMHSTWKGRLAWAIGFLLLYWAAMEWIPVPGVGAGLYEKGNNLASWIDGRLLEGHMWQQTKTWDPEGILSTIPAISTTLFGTLAGQWLAGESTQRDKSAGLLAAGGAAAIAGAIWHLLMPINKSLWTASYSAFMAGLASVCLGAVYHLVDARGWKRLALPASVLGTNAIAAYVLAGIMARLLYTIKITGAGGKAMTVKAWIYETLFASWLGDMNGSIAFSIAFIFVIYLFMSVLYRKKIFIKV